MKGKDLQQLISDSGIKLAELAQKSGIPESTIYKLYKKDKVEAHYLLKLEEAGLKLPKTTNFMPTSEAWDLALEALRNSVKNATDLIQIISDTTDHIKEESKFYQSILKKAHEEGSLVLRTAASMKKT